LDHKFKFMDDFQNYINELKSKHQIWLFAGITTLWGVDIHDPVRNKM
jgi:exodeoxyribonuclease-3